MRLNNINTQALTRILGAKGKGKSGFALFKNVKTRIIAGALALTLAGGAGIGAYNHFHNGSADVPPTDPAITSDSDTPTNDNPQEDQFGLLAEGLEIEGLGMTNTMKTIDERAQEIAEEYGATYKGPTYQVTDENGETQTWVSEEDYEKAVEAGIADKPEGTTSTTYKDEVFIANDGTAFETAADRDAWNAYLKGQKTGSTGATQTDGDYYVAPDGTVWTSEAEYNNYVASNNGQNVTPVDNGGVVEQGEGYRDPNGDYWTSEAEYLEYINSLNQISDGTPSNTNNGTGTSTGTYDDNYYHAPDGSVWSSEQEYTNYINSLSNTPAATSSTEDTTDYTDNGTTYNDNYYHAPDGSVWASEQEYNNYVNSQNTPAATSYVDDTTDYTDNGTGTTDYDSDEYYHAPDGSVWATEADYQNYMNSQVTTYSEGTYVETDDTEYTDTTSVTTEETGKVEDQEENKIQYDQYGGYTDPDSGYYFVYDVETGTLLGVYESQADYLAWIAYEADEAQKTR